MILKVIMVMTNVVNSMIIILFHYVLKVHLSLFLPNGNIVLIAQTVVCLIYTNVGLIHEIGRAACRGRV